MRFEVVSVSLGKTSVWELDALTFRHASAEAARKLRPVGGRIQSIRVLGRTSQVTTDEMMDCYQFGKR
jgi:hypothetical protein